MLASVSTVHFVCFVSWLPFLSNTDLFLQVVRRVFPIQRGLYEVSEVLHCGCDIIEECALSLGLQDKVANFWCAVSVLVKVRQLLPIQVLVIVWSASN